MLTKNINLKNFKFNFKNSIVAKKFENLLKEKNEIINSLGTSYKSSFKREQLKRYKKYTNFRIIGMGGSSLGAKAIYDFLNEKIRKKFEFFDNLQSNIKINKKQKYSNIVISKSGNTLETVINSNLLINKKDKNIFITEKKK